MMQWQPIETAPQDGSPVLFWSAAYGYFAGNIPPGCMAGCWSLIYGRWRGSGDYRAAKATHWAPLESPAEQALQRLAENAQELGMGY